jgi:hypothetical protein
MCGVRGSRRGGPRITTGDGTGSPRTGGPGSPTSRGDGILTITGTGTPTRSSAGSGIRSILSSPYPLRSGTITTLIIIPARIITPRTSVSSGTAAVCGGFHFDPESGGDALPSPVPTPDFPRGNSRFRAGLSTCGGEGAVRASGATTPPSGERAVKRSGRGALPLSGREGRGCRAGQEQARREGSRGSTGPDPEGASDPRKASGERTARRKSARPGRRGCSGNRLRQPDRKVDRNPACRG